MPTIGAKVTNEELAVIAGYAAKSGLSISQLVRAAALREATAAVDIVHMQMENDTPEKKICDEKSGQRSHKMNLIDMLVASMKDKQPRPSA